MMRDCQKFESCSAPFCPLDTEERVAYSDEPKCKLDKTSRFLIGEGHPRHGLTKREWAGKQLSDKIKSGFNDPQTLA
jgi:hypothetical protein